MSSSEDPLEAEEGAAERGGGEGGEGDTLSEQYERISTSPSAALMFLNYPRSLITGSFDVR